MKHRILLVALAFSVLTGGLSACSSPPVVTTHDVGKLEFKKQHVSTAVEATVFEFTALEPAMYSFTGPVIVGQSKAVQSAEVAATLPAKNCSKPHNGLAIRQRAKRSVDGIHLLVVATSGHRLLHIDPGLC